MPSYPRGRVFEGYGGLYTVELLEGARIVRTFIHPSQSARLLPRLANYLSFVASSVLLGGWTIPRCDYVLTESPPLFLGASGVALSRWKRARLVFNVSDLWPESAVRVGVLKPGRLLDASERLEAFCYEHAWLVTGQSQTIVDSINRRFPAVATRLLSNGVDTAQFRPATREEAARATLRTRGRCAAVYAGLHGLAQGLDQLLDAAAVLAGRADVDVLLLGDGPSKRSLVERARSLSLTNLRFLDPVPADEMPGWLAGGDVAIVPLKAFIPGAVPSKLYEAMAVGLPVILVASGEPAEIVKRHRAGIVVEPGDVSGLAEALRLLASNPALRRELGGNGRVAVERHYDRNVISAAFVEHLERQLAAAGRHGDGPGIQRSA
jgi:glycosyltransferase involved in cell wall biosynthesis